MTSKLAAVMGGCAMRYRFFSLAAVLLGLFHGLAHADDLDLYGGQTINVQPNVLIIFDNSSSMMCCWDAACGTPSNCATLANQRLYMAKNAIKNLVNRVSGVNFGLMVFNSNAEGGRLIRPLSNDKDALVTAIDSITTTRPTNSGGASAASSLVAGDYTYTPLAETLAEAGLYFAGQNSWFDTSHYTTYTSPITQPCQKNYIIVMTDGAPTNDNNSWLSSGASGKIYVNGVNKIGNYDQDDRNGDGNRNDADETYNYATSGSDYLDDIAKYLYDNDCRANFGSGEFVKQNIKTYTIGFTTSNSLLNDTAVNGGTVSARTTSDDPASLEQAFNEILAVIQDANAIYTAPVIPRNPENQTDAGDKVYMAYFKPKANGRWVGNLKGYGLVNGILQDAAGTVATYPADPTADGYVAGREGYIKDSARSLWSMSADGSRVDQGGAGALLVGRTDRNIYTWLSQEAAFALTNPNKKQVFAKDNTSTAFNAALGVADDTARNVLIDKVLDTTWPLGDIVHSEPLVESYNLDLNNDSQVDADEWKNYLFVGANDGMLHAFDTTSGSEAWAFVPPGQLAKLQALFSGDGTHRYAVDGSPVIVAAGPSNGRFKLLIFGERRGGSRYYALDVTQPLQPAWKYQVTDSHLGGGAATLGQSWAKPQLKRVRSGGTTKEVFLMAGGYDPERYDTPAAGTNTVQEGRAIYAIQTDNGALFGLNINAANWLNTSVSPVAPYMTDSILDVTGFDKAGYGYLDRIYAGDLGGHVFAARYNKCTNVDCDNDFWQPKVLFDLTSSGLGKKIMTRPEVALESGKECVYFGTGDRENPNGTSAVNAIYAVCNSWAVSQPQPLTIGNLTDVTDNLIQQGDATQKAAVRTALDAGYGWYIRLTYAGEKLTSSPKLLNKKLYFTTFTPGALANNDDPCTVSYDYGVSRLYAVDYLTGAAVYNFNGDDQWTREDRFKIIGTSIAGDPVLTTDGDTTSIYYGSGGKFEGMPVETSPLVRRYFWRQLK